jgi:hypothetical protein
MSNVIAVFNNRNHTMQFASYMKKMGIRCNVINTPRELSVACGISAVFGMNAISQAKLIINNVKFSSFYKLYEVIDFGSVKKYRSI